MKELIKSDDFKTEKHIPVIDILEKGDRITVSVTVGKEIPHPNTTAHHIMWMELYFLPKDDKFPYLLGRYELSSHGASAEGADTSTVYSEPHVQAVFKTGKKGILHALSYCNIHGLWESKAELN